MCAYFFERACRISMRRKQFKQRIERRRLFRKLDYGICLPTNDCMVYEINSNCMDKYIMMRVNNSMLVYDVPTPFTSCACQVTQQLQLASASLFTSSSIAYM